MIVIDLHPDETVLPIGFEPWPAGMPPGGYWDTMTVQATNLRGEWASWPVELRAPLMRDVGGARGVPKLWLAPREQMHRFTTSTADWVGLFVPTTDSVLTTTGSGNIPAHEWGHLVDYSWPERIERNPNLPLLSARPEFRTIYQAALARPGNTGASYMANEREFFAECFSYWARRSTTFYELAFGSDVADRLVAYFNATVPYAGMPTG